MANVMKKLLTDARDILEKRKKAIEEREEDIVFWVNEAQCTRLWKNLRATYDAFSNSPPRQEACLPLLKRFYILVERGDAILEKCSCEKLWLEAAILYGDSHNVFKELSMNLQLCLDLSHSNARMEIPMARGQVAILDDVADEEFHKDVIVLMARLDQELVNESVSRENAKYLASYLIHREKSRLSLGCEKYLDPDEPRVERFYEVQGSDPEHLKILGKGSFGIVSMVNWLGLTCAKKEFLGVDPTNQKAIDDFVKEVSALVTLNHPHIVKLLLSSSVGSNPWFMMELMPMSLDKFIQEQKNTKVPLDVAAAIEMMLQIGLGMEYVHEQGMVHRDLKCANILVDPSKNDLLRKEGYVGIKLVDFGLAKMKVYGLMEPTLDYPGSTKHVAPEVIDLRKRPVDYRIDWRKADTYSFGITCWEILTGEVPYKNVLASQVRQRVKDGLRPELPSNCPAYLGELLQKCWAQSPEDHPSFQQIVSTIYRFRSCLLIGMEPERARAKSRPLLKSLWPFSGNLQFERRVVLCPDQSRKAQFEASIEELVFSKLDAVEVVFGRMKKNLKKIRVCRTQCEHLFQQYLEGIQKVKSTFNESFHTPTLWLCFLCGKLPQCSRCLDGLICSMMAVEELLRVCGGSEWKRIALKISAPPPLKRTYSSFGLCLWELYWNLFVIHCVMLNTKSLQVQSATGNLLIQWCEEKCRLVLRRIIDLQDAEEEFLNGDIERQDEDRNDLLRSLEKSFVGSRNTMYYIFSQLRFHDKSIEDGLAARLKMRLQSTCATIDFVSLQDCYVTDIKEFSVMKRIGRGIENANDVFEAKWLGEAVAISMGAPESYLRDKVEDMVKVQHPNLVQFIGCAYERRYEEQSYDPTGIRHMQGWSIVMELLQENLMDLITRNRRFYSGSPFPLRVAIDMMLQIVEAMLHLHECGVFCALWPDNIFVSPKYMTKSNNTQDMDVYYTVKLKNYRVKILKAVWNSVSYHALENVKLLHSIELTSSEIVWSLGMIAFEIISGSSPFPGLSRGDIHQVLLEGDVRRVLLESIVSHIPDGLPQGLKELIKQCWDIDPNARPSIEGIRKELWNLKYLVDLGS